MAFPALSDRRYVFMFQMCVVQLLAHSECSAADFLHWKEQMRCSGGKGRASRRLKSWSFRNRKTSSYGPAGLPSVVRVSLPLLLAARRAEQLCTTGLQAGAGWAPQRLCVWRLTVFGQGRNSSFIYVHGFKHAACKLI